MAGQHLALPLREPEVSDEVLAEFIRGSQPWAAERVPVPAGLRQALWVLTVVDLVWGCWLATVVGLNPCQGQVCKVATLDPYAPALLGAAVTSLACLLVVAFTTRGLAEADGREVAGLAVAVATGGLALVGIAALLVVALVAVFVLAVFWSVFTWTDSVRRPW